MKNNSKLSWIQIVIRDYEGLPGRNISRVIDLVKDSLQLKYVVINGISGAVVSELIEQENQILDLQSIQKIIREVEQFDWGDFFLFSEYPVAWITSDEKMNYPQLIAQTDMTIRAVDDTYIYLYVKNKQIIDLIKRNYLFEDEKSDFLENFEFPY